MATKKPQKEILTTPKGSFKYPHLSKPDYGTDEYPKEDGVFNVQLLLSKKEADALAARLKPLHDVAVAEGKDKFAKLAVPQRKKLKELQVNELFTEDYDRETEEPTGMYVFKFSTKASGTNAKGEEWNRILPIFDAKGKRIENPPDIWGGTVGRISFTASPYFVAGQGIAGVKLYLEGVQVIELATGGGSGASAEAHGFGEEDGYTQSEGDSFPEDDEGGSAGGDEDF